MPVERGGIIRELLTLVRAGGGMTASTDASTIWWASAARPWFGGARGFGKCCPVCRVIRCEFDHDHSVVLMDGGRRGRGAWSSGGVSVAGGDRRAEDFFTRWVVDTAFQTGSCVSGAGLLSANMQEMLRARKMRGESGRFRCA